MDVRRQEIKITHNGELGIWELRYSNHPRVISYSSSWQLLDDLSVIIIREYFKSLRRAVIQSKACRNIM